MTPREQHQLIHALEKAALVGDQWALLILISMFRDMRQGSPQDQLLDNVGDRLNLWREAQL